MIFFLEKLVDVDLRDFPFDIEALEAQLKIISGIKKLKAQTFTRLIANRNLVKT